MIGAHKPRRPAHLEALANLPLPPSRISISSHTHLAQTAHCRAAARWAFADLAGSSLTKRWLAVASRGRGTGGSLISYDCVMTQSADAGQLPSPSSALLQLARLKAGLTQRELAERADVPVTMISAYERDQRQPTLATLLRLLRAAGFDLRLHLAAYDPHDDILGSLEASRCDAERQARDLQLQAWREAVPADEVA